MSRGFLSVRVYRAGFLTVLALLSGVVLFTLWSEASMGDRLDALTQQALERAHLIGTIRVNALSLESATEAHVRATDASGRADADAVMVEILEDIRGASEAYTRELPPRERAAWERFNATANALAAQVRKAVTFSNLEKAEEARAHLVKAIRPLAVELDRQAGQLAEENASETRALLAEMESLRLRHTAVRVGVFLLGLLLSLAVAWHMTERLRRQEETIHAQLTELDRRNQELDAFAIRVAHDLVTPLAPMRGYITLIRRTPAGQDAGVAEMLTSLEMGVGRVSGLVEALLRFSRAGQAHDSVGELDTAVGVVLMELDQVAARERVRLERQLEAGVRVLCSQQLLQSVAQNLLSNAVKYSAGRPDARVLVRLTREGELAVLEVDDNGRGIGAEAQAKLFQPFFRAREVQALPGYGLGLATVKRIVEGHRGTISVRSAPAEGTRVTVRLPLAPAGAVSRVSNVPHSVVRVDGASTA
ncbi:MAG: ATP-binding protein [Myxococcaceae bacterium]|nr:ATP-binding protein [Myxococcaceae bacterium]